jgi:hypothetical protein
MCQDTKETQSKISDHIHRLGYHFRSTIVEQATIEIGGVQSLRRSGVEQASGEGDPIPETQAEINAQADGAIRDLFPRIPNTDREMIIQHAFQMVCTSHVTHGPKTNNNQGAVFMGRKVVGLQRELSLSRRVQLAVLAHIRHNHTRYDELLRQTDWVTARSAVEPVCLDKVVQWRGDEETGRDQLEEIIREVVVISDSEESDDEDDAEGNSSDGVEVTGLTADFLQSAPPAVPAFGGPLPVPVPAPKLRAAVASAPEKTAHNSGPFRNRKKRNRKDKKEARMKRKGFKRYQAWNDALQRQREPGMVRGDDSSQAYKHVDQLIESRKETTGQEPVSHHFNRTLALLSF